MAILINSCPMCGANIKKEAKECDYCGSALIFTSMDVATLKVSNAIIEENTAKWKDILIESPEDARGNFNLGVIYLNKGLRDAAVDCFRKAVKAEADFTLAHYNLAIALFNDGHNEDGSEIRKEIKLTVLLDPNFSEAKAFQYFLEAGDFKTIDSQKALELYNKAIETNNTIPTFYNNRGVHYSNSLNDQNNAIKDYEKAIEIANLKNLSTLTYYNNKMNALVNYNEMFDFGIEIEKQVSNSSIKSNDGDKALFYTNLAFICININPGKWDEALNLIKLGIFYDKSSKYKKNTFLVYNNYAIYLWNTKKSEETRVEALKYIDLALKYDPLNKTAIANKANILIWKLPKSGCFIATASMGNYDHPVVLDLRFFRDNWLLKRDWGISFTKWYYKHGPIAASFIEKSVILKKLTFFLIIKPLQLIAIHLK
jgi:tetratricopeptide (TPR) repeat protein